MRLNRSTRGQSLHTIAPAEILCSGRFDIWFSPHLPSVGGPGPWQTKRTLNAGMGNPPGVPHTQGILILSSLLRNYKDLELSALSIQHDYHSRSTLKRNSSRFNSPALLPSEAGKAFCPWRFEAYSVRFLSGMPSSDSSS